MKRRVVELDGLRGVAVMMVVFGHAQGTLAGGYQGWLSPLQIFTDAEMGVRVFFILSGYLITTILMSEFASSGRIYLMDFYKRRVLRIFPAFYTYLIFVTILALAGVVPMAGTLLLSSALFLYNYLVGILLVFHLKNIDWTNYTVVGHFWTLSLEEQFYWVWPLTLLFILKKRAFALVPILILIVPVIRFVTYFISPGTRGQLLMMFHTGSDVILFGCLLAIYSIQRPDWVKRLVLPSWVVTGLILFTLIIIPRVELFFHSVMVRKIWATSNYTVESTILTVIIANILLQPGEWYARLLRSRILVFLGTISYSLYLWQQIFCCLPLNTTFTGKFPFNIIIAIGVGFLSYRFIERPFLLVKSKRYSHSAPSGETGKVESVANKA